MSNAHAIQARGSGLPGRGEAREWPTRWRTWIRRSAWRKKQFGRLERTLRLRGIGYKTTTPYSFLLSFPRSGNHLLRYIIESISGYATWGAAAGVGTRFTSRSPDTQIFLKVPMKIVSRRAIVIKRHTMTRVDDRSMSLALLVRLPHQAIISHLSLARLDSHLDEFVTEFVSMCESVDAWPAPTSIHFLEDFTRGTDDEFIDATSRLLRDIHLTDFTVQLERFARHRTEHFARAIWSLERRPKSATIEWDSELVRGVGDVIVSRLRANQVSSPTLAQIMNHYYGETSPKRRNRQT